MAVGVKNKMAAAKAGTSAKSKDIIASTASEIENLTKAKAFILSNTLREEIGFTAFKRGGVLAKIFDEGWYKAEGYDKFQDFVEATQDDLKYRKAMYLISIYKALVDKEISWDQVAHIGWTKLKELTAIFDGENTEEWVKKAESLTVLQLKDAINAFLNKQDSDGEGGGEGATGGSDEEPTTTTITFKLHVDQKETVREAIEKAKTDGNTSVDAVALEAMAVNYLAATGGKKPKATLTQKLLKEAGADKVKDMLAKALPDLQIGEQGESVPFDTVDAGTVSEALKVMELGPAMDAVQEAFPEEQFTVGDPVEGEGGEVDLSVLMNKLGAEAILEAFDTVFPDIEVTVSMPEES